MSIFSTPDELEKMRRILVSYMRMPFYQSNIPGSLIESIFSYVHEGGVVLKTYDFVDVILPEIKCGWQIKSTKSKTPVTWKRAKIPNAMELIEESKLTEQGLQSLGNAIIEFCNQHARESLEKYNLDEIGYSRLISHENGQVTYFERLLCSRNRPDIFNPLDFKWSWSRPKRVQKKEQLPALHGIHRTTGEKWWAWHGQGENQLHFVREQLWWPDEDDPYMFSFQMPSDAERLSYGEFADLMPN